jgi:predicted Zn-ribbon and HTH transcriptional regulator
MSDSVRDLLVCGIVAAKAQDKEEARHFLRWVLRRDDAGPDQEAQAWLWLSQVSDDPAEKRECLRQVLAIEPHNALAKQGLAILDGRLKPEDIVDHRKPIRPIKPLKRPPPASVRRYVCPKCGGKMAFDPAKRALACGYCGNQMSEYAAVLGDSLEQDFVATLPTAKAHRWELPVARALKCQGCGATFALLPACVTGACPFCESAHIIEAAETRELVQPEGMLPFQNQADVITRRVHRWLKEQRFCPDALKKKATTVPPRGVYLPFWTFDVGGMVKVYKPPPEPLGGGRYKLYPTLHTAVNDSAVNFENHTVYFNDLLVPATHSLPMELLGGLTDFTLTVLVPYSSDLLADWPAEIYQVAMADASLVARQRAFEATKNRIGSFGFEDLRISSAGIVIESYKLVLLPVWVTGYRFAGKYYPLVVNDQTRKVVGEVPRSDVQKLVAGVASILGKVTR